MGRPSRGTHFRHANNANHLGFIFICEYLRCEHTQDENHNEIMQNHGLYRLPKQLDKLLKLITLSSSFYK